MTDEDDIATTTDDRSTQEELIAELRALRAVFAEYVLHHLAKGDDEKARANNAHRDRIDALIEKTRNIP